MRLGRWFLPALAVWLCACSVRAEKLTIVFSGACDFVPIKATGGMKVVLPAWADSYAGQSLGTAHKQFVRQESVAYLFPKKPATIQIKTKDGILPAGRVITTRFDPHIHKIDGKPSEDVMKKGVTFELPEGELVAGEFRPEKYAFVTQPTKPPTNERVEPMANEASLVLTFANSGPVTLMLGDTELRVAFKNGAATVIVGNLPEADIFYQPGQYEPMCADGHYLLHYTLDPSYDVSKASVPKRFDPRCPGVSEADARAAGWLPPPPAQGPPPGQSQGGMSMPPSGSVPSFGPRSDCYMGRWPV